MKKAICKYLMYAMLAGMPLTVLNIPANIQNVYAADVIEEKEGVLNDSISYKLDTEGVLHIYNPQIDVLKTLSGKLKTDGVDLTQIKQVKFENIVRISKLDYMFKDMENLTTVNWSLLQGEKIETVKAGKTEYTYETQSLANAFENCKSLEKIDLSGLNFVLTNNTDEDSEKMSDAFYNCINLTEIKFSNTTMPYLIKNDCYKLISEGHSKYTIAAVDPTIYPHHCFYAWTNPMENLGGGESVAGKVAKRGYLAHHIDTTASYNDIEFTINSGIVDIPIEQESFYNKETKTYSFKTPIGYRFDWTEFSKHYPDIEITKDDTAVRTSFDAEYILKKCTQIDKGIYKCLYLPKLVSVFDEDIAPSDTPTDSNEEPGTPTDSPDKPTNPSDNEEETDTPKESNENPNSDKTDDKSTPTDNPADSTDISKPSTTTDISSESDKGLNKVVTPQTTTDKNSDNLATITPNKNENPLIEQTTITPLKITKVKNVKGKKAKISWNKDINSKKYEIQISIKKNFKKNVKVYKTAKTSYIIKKLKKNKTYYIRVRGINDDNIGKWSKTIKIKIKK